jgi:hypothetical protein
MEFAVLGDQRRITLAAMHIGCRFFSRRLLWSKKTGHDFSSFFPSSKNRSA